MKVFDTVNNVELEADTKKLVDIMVDGRQVDVYLKEKKSDEDGYMRRKEKRDIYESSNCISRHHDIQKTEG